MRIYRLMLVVATLSCSGLVARAGVLDDFERDATQDRSDDRDDGYYGYDYWHHDPYYYEDGGGRRRGGGSFGLGWELEPHKKGEPVMAYFRLDGAHQSVESNVDARDYYA